MAHNRYMAPRRKHKVEIRKDGVSCCPNTHSLQSNGNPWLEAMGGADACRRLPRRHLRPPPPVLPGFKEAESGIAMARVLPGKQHQFLPEAGMRRAQ